MNVSVINKSVKVKSSQSGGGPSIPTQITAMYGQIIGPPLGEIEIEAGDCLYLKVKRLEAGDGVISGPVSIAGEVVSVSDGTNAAQVAVSDFDEVGDTVVLILKIISDGVRSFMRVGSVTNG